MTAEVSVVLGSYQRLFFLKRTIASVRQELQSVPHEIIVVDGGSTDGSIEWLAGQRDVLTIVQHNRGMWNGKPVERRSWGYFMNLGFRSAAAEYICMISDDCLVVPGAIRNGLARFRQRTAEGVRLGGLAFYWRNWPEQTLYNVGLTLGKKVFINHGLYLKSALEEVGYADEKTFRFYHGDSDLALKLWHAGYVCEASPESFIEHYSHANTTVRATNFEGERADWEAFTRKWSGIFYDPSSPETGSWQEIAFDDPHRTARGFASMQRRRVGHNAKALIKRVIGRAGLLDQATRLVRRLRGTEL